MNTPFAPLSEVCIFIKDGTHGSPVRATVGVPVLSAEHVNDGRLSLATTRFTTEGELTAFRKRLHPMPGDVLLTIVGTIGRTAVLTDATPLIFQRSVCVLRPRTTVLCAEYLRWALESAPVKKQLLRETKQSAQAGIYLDSINEIAIPVPPVFEQHRIARQLTQVDRLRRTRRYALELSDSFIPAAFREVFGADGNKFLSTTVEELASKRPHAIRTGPFGSQLLHLRCGATATSSSEPPRSALAVICTMPSSAFTAVETRRRDFQSLQEVNAALAWMQTHDHVNQRNSRP